MSPLLTIDSGAPCGAIVGKTVGEAMLVTAPAIGSNLEEDWFPIDLVSC